MGRTLQLGDARVDEATAAEFCRRIVPWNQRDRTHRIGTMCLYYRCRLHRSRLGGQAGAKEVKAMPSVKGLLAMPIWWVAYSARRGAATVATATTAITLGAGVRLAARGYGGFHRRGIAGHDVELAPEAGCSSSQRS
jgi:hypothetical protein